MAEDWNNCDSLDSSIDISDDNNLLSDPMSFEQEDPGKIDNV